ncbi:MAG: hypothetical protein WAK55_17790, partial [Xanthobacteraceae bacterium]
LDTVREPHGRSRLFLEDYPSISPEDDDASMSLEDDASMSVMPSATKRIFRASAVFLFVFLVLAGVGGALAWRSYGDRATNMISALPTTTTKPDDSPEASLQELQQQLTSIATDLAAVKQTLEQQSAANHDQLTRIQEQIAEQSIALRSTKQELEKPSSPTLADQPVPIPPRKPAQHPAHSAQESSKPIQVSPPQSLLPPKQ